MTTSNQKLYAFYERIIAERPSEDPRLLELTLRSTIPMLAEHVREALAAIEPEELDRKLEACAGKLLELRSDDARALEISPAAALPAGE